MALIHDSKGIVSEQELAALEKQLGINLSNDYREFLKKNNGGYPEPDGFSFANREDGSTVDRFLEISDSKTASIMGYYNTYKSRIPTNYFPIAKDPGGNLILIEIGNDEAGIYFWDHENEAEDGDLPGVENIHLISSNFNDFINNLYEIEI